ncbi:MAG TPA: hypothetical protein PKA42_03210 [Candidatus Paceibacterota bacterium]|nr:hypothetical protein [Candidatus Paceibacterota bacterium]HMO83150.1 hypothetical protein [Candidatus Paceibacterota bacterium]
MTTPTSFKGLVNELLGIINLIIPLIFGVIFIFLTWKIIDAWIINAGDEKKVEDGKKYALTAVIVVVLMIAAWGIVEMLRSSVLGN